MLQDTTTDVILTGAEQGENDSLLNKNLDSLHDPNFIGLLLVNQYHNLSTLVVLSQNLNKFTLILVVYINPKQNMGVSIRRTDCFAGIPDEMPYQNGRVQNIPAPCGRGSRVGLRAIIFMIGRIRSTRYQGKMQLIMTCAQTEIVFV